MSFKERVLHTGLFELFAVLIGVLAMVLFGGHDSGTSLQLTVLMSLIAAAWTFIYNWIFDKFATGPREKRGPGIRVVHTVLMEAGLLLATVPLIAYYLSLGWLEAFLWDIGLTLLILVYSYVFNWIYDHARLRFVDTP